MDLWQLKVSLKSYQGARYLRFSLLNGKELPVYGRGKNHADIDIAGELANKLERPELIQTARDFTAACGLAVPIPLDIVTAYRVFSLTIFPSLEEWEKSPYYYPEPVFRRDQYAWYKQAHTFRTFEALYRWYYRAVLGGRTRASRQDMAGYARANLDCFYTNLRRLTEFYGGAPELPRGLDQMIEREKQMGQSFIPLSKKDYKKLMRSAEQAQAEPKRRKNQERLGL